MIRRNEKFLPQLYAFIDLICIQLGFLIAWWIKFHSGLIPYEEPLPIGTYYLWVLYFSFIALVVGYSLGFFSTKRRKRYMYEIIKVVQVQGITFFVLVATLFLIKQVDISRLFLSLFIAINVTLLLLYRLLIKRGLMFLRKKGYNQRFVLILGAGSLGKRFYTNLINRPELGYEVKGFLDDDRKKWNLNLNFSPQVLGDIDSLETVLKDNLIDEVIIALPLYAYQKLPNIIELCEKAGAKVHIIPDYFDYLPAKPHFEDFAGIPLINVRDIPLEDVRKRLAKRAFDILFSIIVLVISSPLLLLIAILIRASSPGSIIFKQERVGLDRRKFMMYKFRSMKMTGNEFTDRQWSVEGDPRLTFIGSILRKTSLDELPQFFNVLKGDMSVVGPRPERPFFVEQFMEEIPRYMVKHQIRPGITGLAQSSGLRGDTSIFERIQNDIYYLENWTFMLDVKIILKTVKINFIKKQGC